MTSDPQTFAARSSHIWVLGLLLCAGSAAGCRSKLSVRTTSTPAPIEAVSDKASGTSIPIPDGFTSTRTVFQSRSQITVAVSSKVVQPGERFSLVNTTTDTVLIDQQPLALGPDEVMSQPSYDVMVRFYPLDRETLGRFAYGENRLQVDATDGKTAEQTLTLRDFPVAGMPVAYFEDGSQRQEDGAWSFQGEVSPMARNVLSNGKILLMTGMITIVNQ